MVYFHEHGFTDGNPVILPTEEKVREMLYATSHDPKEWVGQMRAAPPYEAWYFNVEMVAVNAVIWQAQSPNTFLLSWLLPPRVLRQCSAPHLPLPGWLLLMDQ
jgi:hypothetical protein